jgi:hypothetical protein
MQFVILLVILCNPQIIFLYVLNRGDNSRSHVGFGSCLVMGIRLYKSILM